MNVLALNPPFHTRYSRSQRSPGVIKSGVIYYPFWLAYAAGVLEGDGFNVKLVDAPAARLDLSSVLALATTFQPRMVVMDTSTPSIYNDVEVAEAIKSRVPDAFALLVGPHVSALPEESLQISPQVDAVARGEYEYTVRDTARVLAGGGALDAVPGLTHRQTDGSVTSNPPRPLIQNLDALPFVSRVYRRHLRVEDYFYSIARHPEVTIVTGRGCPYNCTYCLWPQTLTGHRYRRRSVPDVAEEFEFIAHEFPQVKEVFIEDDTLTVDEERCITLAEELIRRGNRLAFAANSRPNVSYETMSWLRRAGLRLLCVGFESGEQDVLDAMRKGIKVERFHQFRADARRAGVLVHGCFMAGGPGETRESLTKTLELARGLNPDTAQFFPLMVYPGTDAYEWAKWHGYLDTEDFREWLTSDGLHRSVVSQPGLPAEDLVAWCDQARRAFYLRPRYVAGKVWQITTRPAETVRILRAARIFIKYLLRPSLPAKHVDIRYAGDQEVGIRGRVAVVKRLMDMVGALVGILCFSPLMIVASLLIRLTSDGPALFIQERVGKNGRVFGMYKLRTMVEGAEELLDGLIDPRTAEEPLLKIRDDPRVTPVGRILRRWSMDELPQLVNVLKGDMSLVGPRPEEIRIMPYYTSWQMRRFLAKPGVTGPAQIGGRADLPLEERARLEVDYIENYTLCRDLQILLQTIPAVIRGLGSY